MERNALLNWINTFLLTCFLPEITMPGQIIDDRYTNGMGIGAAMEISSAPTTGITTACVWRLQPPQEDVVSKQVPANTEVLYNGRRNLESVIGRDDRVLVDDEDIMPGGKYRGMQLHCPVNTAHLTPNNQQS